MSICGYDDSLLANHFTPRITSVKQPAKEMAQSAVEQLLAIIEDRNAGCYATKFAPKLMEKDSTAKRE
jgi:DNA-binding LacI/PurR family transcriptional regulator